MKHPFVFFCAALILCSCGRPVDTKTPELPPVPVEAATVEKRTMPVEVKAIGVVEPVASVMVKSKVQGEILKVHFADGATVNAGDILFSIDPRMFEAALKRAQANLAMANADAANANEQAERYETLIKRGAASKEQTAQFLTAAATRKAELAARQAEVDDAQLSLDWTEVRSPISGRAGAALLKAGNIAQAHGETLAIINQMQPIYVAFSLPESQLADLRYWIREGNPVITTYSPDTGQLLGTGELSFVDNVIDRGTGMVAFKATFPNAEETLWPGQFVDVTIRLNEQPGAIVVPAVSIMDGQQGSQVFVIENDVAHLRKVKVGRTINGESIVTEGLQPGEQVVTVGQLRISNGGKVTVKNPAKATAEP